MITPGGRDRLLSSNITTLQISSFFCLRAFLCIVPFCADVPLRNYTLTVGDLPQCLRAQIVLVRQLLNVSKMSLKRVTMPHNYFTIFNRF